VVVYLRLLAWPSGQSADWSFPTSPGLSDPATLAAAVAVLVVAGSSALLLARGRRRATAGGAAMRLGGLGLAWFLVVLSTTSSVVPLADALAEHRTYLASWGIFLAAVSGADALLARPAASRLAAIAWVALLLLLGGLLHRRNGAWETKVSLWSDVVERTPTSARGRLNLGNALLERGLVDEAIAQYLLAIESADPRGPLAAKAFLNLGLAQARAGRLREARRAYDEGLRLAPSDAGLLASLALVSGLEGDGEAAEVLAHRAVSVDPSQLEAWMILGHRALERGDGAAALGALDRAVALDPDRGDAHLARAQALRLLGRAGAECAALRDVLQARHLPEDAAEARARLSAGCR
jgi:tetratricopeptide (TPR) repeat protein